MDKHDSSESAPGHSRLPHDSDKQRKPSDSESVDPRRNLAYHIDRNEVTVVHTPSQTAPLASRSAPATDASDAEALKIRPWSQSRKSSRGKAKAATTDDQSSGHSGDAPGTRYLHPHAGSSHPYQPRGQRGSGRRREGDHANMTSESSQASNDEVGGTSRRPVDIGHALDGAARRFPSSYPARLSELTTFNSSLPTHSQSLPPTPIPGLAHGPQPHAPASAGGFGQIGELQEYFQSGIAQFRSGYRSPDMSLEDPNHAQSSSQANFMPDYEMAGQINVPSSSSELSSDAASFQRPNSALNRPFEMAATNWDSQAAPNMGSINVTSSSELSAGAGTEPFDRTSSSFGLFDPASMGWSSGTAGAGPWSHAFNPQTSSADGRGSGAASADVDMDYRDGLTPNQELINTRQQTHTQSFSSPVDANDDDEDDEEEEGQTDEEEQIERRETTVDPPQAPSTPAFEGAGTHHPSAANFFLPDVSGMEDTKLNLFPQVMTRGATNKESDFGRVPVMFTHSITDAIRPRLETFMGSVRSSLRSNIDPSTRFDHATSPLQERGKVSDRRFWSVATSPFQISPSRGADYAQIMAWIGAGKPFCSPASKLCDPSDFELLTINPNHAAAIAAYDSTTAGARSFARFLDQKSMSILKSHKHYPTLSAAISAEDSTAILQEALRLYIGDAHAHALASTTNPAKLEEEVNAQVANNLASPTGLTASVIKAATWYLFQELEGNTPRPEVPRLRVKFTPTNSSNPHDPHSVAAPWIGDEVSYCAGGNIEFAKQTMKFLSGNTANADPLESESKLRKLATTNLLALTSSSTSISLLRLISGGGVLPADDDFLNLESRTRRLHRMYLWRCQVLHQISSQTDQVMADNILLGKMHDQVTEEFAQLERALKGAEEYHPFKSSDRWNVSFHLE